MSRRFDETKRAVKKAKLCQEEVIHSITDELGLQPPFTREAQEDTPMSDASSSSSSSFVPLKIRWNSTTGDVVAALEYHRKYASNSLVPIDQLPISPEAKWERLRLKLKAVNEKLERDRHYRAIKVLRFGTDDLKDYQFDMDLSTD